MLHHHRGLLVCPWLRAMTFHLLATFHPQVGTHYSSSNRSPMSSLMLQQQGHLPINPMDNPTDVHSSPPHSNPPPFSNNQRHFSSKGPLKMQHSRAAWASCWAPSKPASASGRREQGRPSSRPSTGKGLVELWRSKVAWTQRQASFKPGMSVMHPRCAHTAVTSSAVRPLYSCHARYRLRLLGAFQWQAPTTPYCVFLCFTQHVAGLQGQNAQRPIMACITWQRQTP